MCLFRSRLNLSGDVGHRATSSRRAVRRRLWRRWRAAPAPPRQMRSVPPPAFGGLCRLKPAFQAGGALRADRRHAVPYT